MRISLSGRVSIEANGATLDERSFAGRQGRLVFAYLLAAEGRPVPRDELADVLWGDAPPARWEKALSVLVSKLRALLEECGVDSHGALRSAFGCYQLVLPAGTWIDVVAAREAASRAEAALHTGEAAAAQDAAAEAAALARRTFLPGQDGFWVEEKRRELSQVLVRALECLADACLAAGDARDAARHAQDLVMLEPYREGGYRRLMQAHAAAGDSAEALRVYERCRRLLADELGAYPSPDTESLHRDLLRAPMSQGRAASPDTGLADVELEPKRLGRGETTVPSPEAPPVGERRRRRRLVVARLDPARREARTATGDFVGRTDELEHLEGLLDAADGGAGSTVLVSGPAGIGKSRLVAELGERALRRGMVVLRGRCIQLVGAGVPYLPLAEALRPLAGTSATGSLSGELRELPLLVPGLADPAVVEPRDAAPTESRLRLFQEVLLVLENLSARAPVVVALEDLQWADASTLDLFAFLAHSVARARVLLLGTYRTEEVAPGDPLQRVSSGVVGGRAATSLELDPLGREAVEALVASSSARPLPPALVETIVVRSEGNPLFATELVAAVADGEAPLPPALRDMLLADVARLDANARAALRAAAATRRDPSYELLAAVTPLDDETLAAALRQAVEHGILVPDQAARSFRFRHALFAEAIYDTLVPGEREVLHERIARALSDEPRLAMGGRAAAESAEHWSAARRPTEALAASIEAAKEAEQISGLTEALGHLERVLALWNEVPDAEELAGVALPEILSRAADLASMTAATEDETDLRRVVGVLDFDEWWDVPTIAGRLAIPRAAAEKWLAALEHSGLVERSGDAFRAAPLAMSEARRLYPAAVMLESVAVRRSPPFDEEKLDELRRANASLHAAANDPSAAIAADDEFHRIVTAACGDDELVSALLPIKRALLRYELVYMSDPSRVERSVAQHAAIIAALERGEHADAAQLLRENLAHGLPDLRRAVERRGPPEGDEAELTSGRHRERDDEVRSPEVIRPPEQQRLG